MEGESFDPFGQKSNEGKQAFALQQNVMCIDCVTGNMSDLRDSCVMSHPSDERPGVEGIVFFGASVSLLAKHLMMVT